MVIVGAGFAGLNAIRGLSRATDLDVTVIDRENHHLFQPLLYQVAMAALSPADIAVPVRSLVATDRHVRVIKATAQKVDSSRQVVVTDSGEFPFDFLMLACGAQHTYFGHDEWESAAPGLKTLPQATEIRRRVLEAFEAAEREPSLDRQRQHLTFVIVGAGPTGVELAGAIGEMSRYTLAKDFRTIDPRQTRVILVEAGPRILPAFDASLAARAMRDLESLGVQTWTSARVTAIGESGVTIGTEHVASSTVLWAAGVKASELGRDSGFPIDEVGRVLVQPDLSVTNFPSIFVCGDMARCIGPDGKPLPGVGAVAAQQGAHVARMVIQSLNIQSLNGTPRLPFKYSDKGKMATIGQSRAVVEMGRFKLGGRIAWWFWLLVHIYYLNGFRNRLSVMLNWAWSYVTFNRGARLIVGKEWRLYGDRKT